MKLLATTVLVTLVSSLALIAYNGGVFSEKETFGMRLNRIAREVNAKNTTWTAHTDGRFTDFKKSDFIGKFGTYLTGSHEDIETLATIEYDSVKAAPATFDSRTNWDQCSSIREIRDQSSCGSCWAFSSVEAMSDRICIFSKGKSQPRISPTDVLSCCQTCGSGCQGGFPGMAYRYWQRNGIVTGDLFGDKKTCQPYPFKCGTKDTEPCPPGEGYETPQCDRQCIPEYKTAFNDDKWYGQRVYNAAGEANMVNEISKNGPVTGAFTVYEDFTTYQGGIYQHVTGDDLGGHAIKIIGYGSENGTKYWIIANSWDYGWGEQGYFRMIRGINNCGIENKIWAGIPKL